MGGLCSAAQQTSVDGIRTIQEAPMLSLDDFQDDQKQYVG